MKSCIYPISDVKMDNSCTLIFLSARNILSVDKETMNVFKNMLMQIHT